MPLDVKFQSIILLKKYLLQFGKIEVPPSFVKNNGKLGNGRIRKQFKYTKRELNKLPVAAQTDLAKWKDFDYEANEVP